MNKIKYHAVNFICTLYIILPLLAIYFHRLGGKITAATFYDKIAIVFIKISLKYFCKRTNQYL